MPPPFGENLFLSRTDGGSSIVTALAAVRGRRGRIRLYFYIEAGHDACHDTDEGNDRQDLVGDSRRRGRRELQPVLRRHPVARAAQAAGFNGAYLLRRDLGEDGTVELTAHTFWESAEVIRAFAGDDITVSVVEPEAQAMLLDYDRSAAHRSVVVDARD
jgi:hypothetical protein